MIEARVGRLLLLLALSVAAPLRAQPTDGAASLFGAREGIEQIDLSPDGRRVVYLTPGPGTSTVVLVQELSADSPPQVAMRSDGSPERIRWCNFADNDRIVCQITALIERGPTFTPFERLMAVDIDGGNPKLLVRRAYGQFDGDVIDWLPDQPGFVLLARSGRVDRVDVRSLRSSTHERRNANWGTFMTDGRGNVRIMAVSTVRGATGMLGSRIAFFYRIRDNHRWQPLGDYDTVSREGLYPVAVDPDGNAAYVLKKLNGRRALYRISLDGSMTTDLVHASDQVDVDNVVRIRQGAQVIGVTFADEMRRKVYFDPAFEALAQSLGRTIPNLPLLDFIESSTDGDRLLVHAGSDSDPGRYFLFERSTRRLTEILLDRPPLENVRLAAVRFVTYAAADGAQIPAYLTLPPNGAGRYLPAVILPHGGPSSRDEWGFDWLAQYLAHRGYAVLQPNYRGSAGYGDEWLQQNGFRSWRTSIGDISAGARWLAHQGIADPARLAILGWSYGGYAALQSGVTEPELFRAVVAIAPVTDLQELRSDARMFTSGRNFAEFLGDGPHLREGSPARHAERMAAPVLMFHGERDVNVLVGHSRAMDRALREAGRSSELVTFPGLEHDLASGEARGQMLERIDAFLRQHLGR